MRRMGKTTMAGLASRVALATLMVGGLASGLSTATPHAAAAATPPAARTAVTGQHGGMPLLQALLSSPEGRKLLRGGLDAATLTRLEHTYKAGKPVRLLAPPARGSARRPASGLHPHLTAPSVAVPGARLSLTLAGFAPREEIVARLDGRVLARVKADGHGAVVPTGVSVTIPRATTGDVHTLTAEGMARRDVASASVRVPGIEVSRQAARGGDVAIDGAGFLPGEVMAVTVCPSHGAAYRLGIGGVDSAGRLLPLRLPLPTTLATGAATLVVTGNDGERVSAPLTVAVFSYAPRTPALPAARRYVSHGRGVRPRTLAGVTRAAAPPRAPTRGLTSSPRMLAGVMRAATMTTSWASSTTISVDASSGTDTGGCGAAGATPCRTIGYAIGIAPDRATIAIAAGTYHEHLTIRQRLTLAGAGVGQTIIDGDYNGSVVTVNQTPATISGVTIQHGSASMGGGVHADGATLTLSHDAIVDNVARGTRGTDGQGGSSGNDGNTPDGEAPCNGYTFGQAGGDGSSGANGSGGSGGSDAWGGGVYNSGGALSVDHSTIARNSASGGSGGAGGVGGNAGNGGNGQPAYCNDYGNTASEGGAGGHGGTGGTGGNGGGGGRAGGGGLYNTGGALTVEHSAIYDNAATGGSGGAGGSGAGGGAGGSGGAGFNAGGSGFDGGAGGAGGVGADGGAGAGGGVLTDGSGSLTIRTSTLTANTAASGAGGNGAQGAGGGNGGGNGGCVTSDPNTGDPAGRNQCAGGPGNQGHTGSTGANGNGGNTGSASGGGIEVWSGGAAITAATIWDNHGGAGVDVASGASTSTLADSIVGFNHGADCHGALSSRGYNLLWNTTNCSFATTTGDQTGLDAHLNGLGNNDGPTLTLAPQANSPALAAIPANLCPDTTDQRDIPRPDPQVGKCAIGAYEPHGAPVIDSIDPRGGPLNGGTVVKLYGHDLDGASAVTFDGTPALSVSPATDGRSVTVTIPAHGAGAVDVHATTPVGGADAPSGTFAYYNPPSVNTGALSPAIGPLSGGMQVTITGTNFVSGQTRVLFDGTDATVVSVSGSLNASVLTALTPAHVTTGPVSVKVVTPGGQTDGAATYTYAPVPTISALVPAHGPLRGKPVEIDGAHFAAGGPISDATVQVTVGGSAAALDPSKSSDDTHLYVVAPASATAGSVPVVVTTAGGPTDGAARFAYIAAPMISRITLADGPLGGGSVEIDGTDFSGGAGLVSAATTAITVGGQLASLDLSKPNDDTHLYVTVPATDTAGAVDVVVATEDGVATRTGGFTYRLAPTVSAVSERYGPLVSPTTVVITGANFVAGETTVHFGSAGVAGVVNADGTVVTATTTGGSGSVALSVTTDGGAADAGAFTYVAPPAVDSVNPTTGPATGGTTVTLTGADFVPGETQVFFGGVAATALTVTGSLDHATLTAVAPPHAVSDFTPVTITVDAPGGQTDAAPQYTYAPAPTLTSMAPVTGSADSGDAITITGTGFTLDSQVLFGATPADLVTVISSTELVATEPGGSGAVDVAIVATGGTTPVVDAGRFTYVVPGACPSVAGAGYTRTIGGWTLTSPNAPLNGSLASVTLTPPSLLHLTRSVTLHCVAIGADGAPALPLTLPTLSLSYQGFAVTAICATLDGNGLRAGLLALALPAAVVPGNALPTITASGVAFGHDGAAVGTMTFHDTRITLAGFTLAASGVTLAGGTLAIGTASLALPGSLLPGGAAPVTISGPLSLTSGGSISGSLSATLPALSVAGFAVAAGTATLDNNGLVVSGASLTVPGVLTPPGGGPLTLHGTLTVSPSFQVTGSLAIPGAAFGLAGFAASGDIALDATGFHVDNARLTLPASLTPSGSAPIALTGGFQVTTDHKVIGSLSSGAVTLTVAGFSAAVHNVTLDNSGLTVTGASLAVPDLGASVSSLALSGDLHIAPDYTVAGSVAVAPFSVQANGVGVAVNGVALGNGGLDAIASAVLPAPFDTTDAVGALHVAPDHTISATLSLAVPTFRAAGLTVDADALTANVMRTPARNGQPAASNVVLTLAGAHAILAPLGNATVTGDAAATIDPSGALRLTGDLTLAHPRLAYYGFGIAAASVVAHMQLDHPAGASASTTVGVTVNGASVVLPGDLSGLTPAGTLTATVDPNGGIALTGDLAVANPRFSYRGLQIGAASITAHLQAIPGAGSGASLDLRVDNASASLPDLAPGITLTGSLTAHIANGGASALDGSLSMNHPSFSYAGFTVSAGSIGVDFQAAGATGTSLTLRVSNASITLPDALAGVTLAGNLTVTVAAGQKTQVDGQLVATGAGGGPIHLAYAGFTVDVADITLDKTGVSVDGVTLTLPDSLRVHGQPIVLRGALTARMVDGRVQVGGSLMLPNVAITVYGFTLAADDVSLGSDGLTVGTALLDARSVFTDVGLNVRTLSVSGLRIDPHFHLSGGAVHIDGSHSVQADLGVATLSIDTLTIGSAGLHADVATLALPDPLDSSLAFHDLTFAPGKKSLVLHSGAADLTLAGLNVHADTLDVSKATGLRATNLALTIPGLDSPVSIGDIGFDPSTHKITFGGLDLPTSFHVPSLGTGSPISPDSQKAACKDSGGTYLALPSMKAGGFGVTGAGGCLSFPKAASQAHSGWLLVGQGNLQLKAILVATSFEFGSVDDTHPSAFHQAAINMQFPEGIPLGTVPLKINGIVGGAGVSRGDMGIIVSVTAGLDVTDDSGQLFQGTGTASFANDGNFGANVTGTLLKFINVYGGFCVRISGAVDYVCHESLKNDPQFAQNATGTGLYAIVGGNAAFTINETITARLQGRLHMWTDGDGPEMAASVNANLHIPAGSFYVYPWNALDFNAYAELGKFRNGGDKVAGLKAGVDIPLDFFLFSTSIHEDVFVYANGGFTLSGVSDYSLIQGQNNTGYLLADNGLGHGVTSLSQVAATVAPATVALAGTQPALTGRLGARLTARSAGAAPVAGVTRRGAPANSFYQNDVDVRVVPGQKTTVFGLRWKRGAPTLTVTAPDGTVYTYGHTGAGAGAFQTTDRRHLPAGDAGETVVAIATPRPGAWRVVVGHLTGHEDYRLDVAGQLPRPTLTVTAPTAGQTLVANPTARLMGTLKGADPAVAQTVSLYYTTTPTLTIGGKVRPNRTGTLIAQGVPVTGGRWAAAWDASAVPAGRYYVYAVLDDGTGPDVAAYAAGTVSVTQPAHPAAPRAVVSTESDRQLTLFWTPPARAGNVAGYLLRWRTDAMPAGQYINVDLGAGTTYNMVEALRGARYSAEVASYDPSGRLSPWVAAATPPATVAADFSLVAGRGVAQEGGAVTIPLRLSPAAGAHASGGEGDFAALTMDQASLPAGLTAYPATTAVNLFSPGQGPAAPALRVTVDGATRPGVYRVRVLAQQSQGGRVARTRAAMATLIVQGGGPAVVALRAGKPLALANGLMQATVTARVTDASGAPVGDGHTLRFSGDLGSFPRDRAEISGGVARATLVYPHGARPIVTADAGSVLGSLYVGPTPRGASTDRYFAAAAGQAARPGWAALGEDLVLHNPLSGPAIARVRLAVQQDGVVRERTAIVTVAPGQDAVEPLDTLAQGYPLVGAEVRSDLPLVTTRRVRARDAAGRMVVLGRTEGVDRPATAYRLRPRGRRGLLDLFNAGPRTAHIRVTVTIPAAGRAPRRPIARTTLALTLPAGGSVQLATGDLATRLLAAPSYRRGRWDRAALTVEARADRPVVVERGPTTGALALRPAAVSPACVGVRGSLPLCPRHHIVHR